MPGRGPGFESCLGHSPAWCPRGKLLHALGLRVLSCKLHDLNWASYTTTHGCGRILGTLSPKELSPCLVHSRRSAVGGACQGGPPVLGLFPRRLPKFQQGIQDPEELSASPPSGTELDLGILTTECWVETMDIKEVQFSENISLPCHYPEGGTEAHRRAGSCEATQQWER